MTSLDAFYGEISEELDLLICVAETAERARNLFGHAHQNMKVVEECSELAAECLREMQGRAEREKLEEEAADVLITVLGLVDHLNAWGTLRRKLAKLEGIIKTAEEREVLDTADETLVHFVEKELATTTEDQEVKQ